LSIIHHSSFIIHHSYFIIHTLSFRATAGRKPMSPDPSVHEESLRAIEQERRRKPKKGCGGCFLFLVLLLIAGGAAALIFRDKWKPLFSGDTYKSLVRKGETLRQTPPRDVLRDLRAKAASLQDEWGKLNESGKLRERLESLRDDLVAKRDQVGEAARKEWEDVVKKSEELLEKARQQKEKLPPLELGELRGKLESLEERLRTLGGSGKSAEEGKTQAKPEEETPEKPAEGKSEQPEESKQDQPAESEPK
jgi:hypothetical protein